jgi:uncharacterized membrane protein
MQRMNESQEEEAWVRRRRRVLRSLADAISENQWILPVVGSVIGGILAFVMGRPGGPLDTGTWTISAAEARSGLISALSILFAGLSIVLALASVTTQNVVGRFSLRMLRIYLRDPREKSVIAMFALVATFILVELYQLRFLPPDAFAPVGGILISMLLLFMSGATIIWYIAVLPRWFLIDHTAKRVGRMILNAALAVEKEHQEDPPPVESFSLCPPDAISVLAHRSGYLTEVDAQGLLDLAVQYDADYVIDFGVGRRVVRGEPIGWMVMGKNTAGELPPLDRVADTLDITEVRELDSAVGYGLIVLVDMAIMALSPGINDPNTAVQVIEEMMFLFPELARFHLGPFGRTDEDGRQRVAVQALTYGDYVDMATTQIVLYSGEDPAVIESLQHFVRVLEALDLSEKDQEAVEKFTSKVQRLGKQNSLVEE